MKQNSDNREYVLKTVKENGKLLEFAMEDFKDDREIVFEGVDAPCVSTFYDNTIMCYSFSKSLSLPGERIGYVAINPACKESATLVNMCGQISRGIGHNCPPSIIQLAVAEVLDKTSDLSVYERNMNLLYDTLTELGFTVVKPGGTFYIFPKAVEIFQTNLAEYQATLVLNPATELDPILDSARELYGIYSKTMSIFNLPFNLMVPLTACIVPGV